MASIVPNFQYDIFISYRHNDNQDGWVTHFVEHLQKELKATIKDPISVYFDANPHDGLLESHHVDKSLEGKLKCLIFIPILSQTYCDPKSFAWQHEFCAFNKLSKEDQFGREIKLRNGNVASRILPVKIHEIEPDDKLTFETEIGGVLRAIELIYKEPGVNRPLKPTDHKNDNLNKTEYKNQINKIANAIKEIMATLKNPKKDATIDPIKGSDESPKKSYRYLLFILVGIILLAGGLYFLYPLFTKGHEPVLLDKSIAVLPFTDMSPEKDQEYFGDGIAEDIITDLSRIEELKVIGRTSSFQFKGQNVDLREVGQKLGVSVVLQGSVMKSGNKIRITAQLIKVMDGSTLWSERYDRELNDIFTVQDEIANMIVDKMKLSIIYHDRGGKSKIRTSNLDAYDYLLKGQHLLNNGIHNARLAQPLFEKATELDPGFIDAHYGLAFCYYLLPLINELTPHQAVEKVTSIAHKILELDSSDYMSHQLLFMVYYHYEHNWAKAEEEYKKSMRIRSTPTVIHALFQHDIYQDNESAIQELKDYLQSNPMNHDALRILAHVYAANKQHDLSENTLQQVIGLDSLFGPAWCELGTLRMYEHNYELAYQNFQTCERISPQWSGKTGLIMSLVKNGKLNEAKTLAQTITSKMNPGTNVHVYFSLGEMDKGFEWLEKAYQAGDPIIAQIRDLPALFSIESDPRYIEMVKRLNFPK